MGQGKRHLHLGLHKLIPQQPGLDVIREDNPIFLLGPCYTALQTGAGIPMLSSTVSYTVSGLLNATLGPLHIKQQVSIHIRTQIKVHA